MAGYLDLAGYGRRNRSGMLNSAGTSVSSPHSMFSAGLASEAQRRRFVVDNTMIMSVEPIRLYRLSVQHE